MRAGHNPAMAYSAPTPFGSSWGFLGLLLVPLLLLLVIALVVAYRGRIFTRRRGLLVGLTLGAAIRSATSARTRSHSATTSLGERWCRFTDVLRGST